MEVRRVVRRDRRVVDDRGPHGGGRDSVDHLHPFPEQGQIDEGEAQIFALDIRAQQGLCLATYRECSAHALELLRDLDETCVPRLFGAHGLTAQLSIQAENHVRDAKENRPFVAVSKNGDLLPEVKQVIGVIARRTLTLETGHSTPEECLMLIREARKQGVERIVVTHALTPPVRMSIAQMKEAAAMGAYLELVYGRMNLAEYVRAIREVGPEHFVLSTDLGQANNPLHPDGFVAYLAALKKEGFSDADLGRMSKTNPARALGLQ